MLTRVCQPLLSSYNMSYFHFPIINNVCKMKSWPAVLLYNYKVIKLSKRNFSIVLINKKLGMLVQIAFKSNSIFLSIFYLRFNLLKCKFSTSSWIKIFWLLMVILYIFFILFLFRRRIFILITTKARIC